MKHTIRIEHESGSNEICIMNGGTKVLTIHRYIKGKKKLAKKIKKLLNKNYGKENEETWKY